MNTALKTKALPRTYAGLARQFMPRPLRSKLEYNSAVLMIDRLAGFDLNPDQSDYLEAISLFVSQYEDQHYPIQSPRMKPLEALQFLVDEHAMTGEDLGRLLGNRNLGQAILRGEKELTKTHIRRLADHFKVEPGVFLD